ncbi:hypothetical protein HK102_009370 [Quaeritorhiza haematococci]|nr:hypothetical protein HK102_009370 [Quaeritorhiza haematococci]
MGNESPLQDTKSWPDLAIGLYDRLTGRGAEILYEFQDFELLIPSSASPEAAHAKWRMNGVIKIRTRDNVDLRGATIDVVLPDLRTALHLRKRFSRDQRRAWASSTRSTMALTGLELRVWVRGRKVGRIAATSKRSRLAAWLGVDPLELRSAAILAALLGRNSPAPGGGTVTRLVSETR